MESDPLDTLGQPLAEFARNDADPGVRQAALRRAAVLNLVSERLHADEDPAVRDLAAKLYRQLLDGAHPKAPPLEQRLQFTEQIDDAELLEHLAHHGLEAALREAAIRHINRPALTLQCLLQDPDRTLRLRLLDNIDDLKTLQRVVDKSHRKDKQLHQLAANKLRKLKISAGDEDAINKEAELICKALEQHAVTTDRDALLADSEQRWGTIRDAVAPQWATRFDNARAQCLAATRARLEPVTTDTPTDTWRARKMPRMDEPEHPSGEVASSSAQVQRLAAENRFQASLAASAKQPAEVRKNAPRSATNSQPKLDAKPLLTRLEEALDAGNLAAAGKPMQKLQAHSARIPKALAPRWQTARARYAELQRWQQWATRRQRRQLCVDARAMRNSELHPEAIANRIRELRDAWKRLDRLEPASAYNHAANTALRHRFQRLCQRALEPTRAWFDARDAVQNRHNAEIENLLRRSLPDADDIKALTKHRRALVAARRDLNKVAPRARKALANRISQAISQVDQPLRELQDKVAREHDRLIEAARGLMQLEPEQRIAAAHDLQQQWKQLGPGKHQRDRKQWRDFRSAMDAVFNARDDYRKQQAEQRQQALHEGTELLERLQSAAASQQDPSQLQALLQDALRQWKVLDVRDAALARRFDALRDKLEQQVRQLAVAQQQQQYRTWLMTLRKGQTTADMPTELQQALPSTTSPHPDRDTIRTVLVQLEALANVDSPPEDQDLRMQVNLERLQSSLGGGRRAPLLEQLDALLLQWVRCQGDAAGPQGAQERFNAAFEAILQRIN